MREPVTAARVNNHLSFSRTTKFGDQYRLDHHGVTNGSGIAYRDTTVSGSSGVSVPHAVEQYEDRIRSIPTHIQGKS